MASDEDGFDAGLEAALDELFGSDPKEFVATRKRLARERRNAGDAASARTLEATRRPTKSAAALNTLARRRPDLIAALLERSEELKAAQRRLAIGDPGAQRDAMRAQRQALTDATDAAVAILEGTGEAARAEILSTLQGGAADEACGAVLRAGRLERTEVAASGFPDDLASGDVVPADVLAARRSRRKEPASQRKERGPDREDEREREQQRRRDEARRRVADELEHAEASLQRATDDAAAAAARVTEVEARVATLRAEVEAARLELRVAKDRAAASAREVSRRGRDVTRRRG